MPPFADFPLPRLYHSVQFMYKLWFSLHFKYNRTVNVLFAIFQIFINQRSSYIFLMVFRSQAGMVFLHFTGNNGKQIIVALYKMQVLN